MALAGSFRQDHGGTPAASAGRPPKVDLHPPESHAQTFVAMPMRNEAELASEVASAVARHVRNTPGAHILLIDDASTDGTADAVDAALASLSLAPAERACISLLRLSPHAGKAGAILAAFRAIEPKAPADAHFLFTDGDLAYDLGQLQALSEALHYADVAIGVRVGRDERPGLVRFVMGETFNGVARLILNLPHRDTQAGLKGFRIDAARAILTQLRRRDFSFDAEALFLAHRLGLRVAEIEARVSPSHRRKPSRVNLLLDPARMALGLLRVRLDAMLGRYPRVASHEAAEPAR